MKRECILSDEDLTKKRKVIEKNKIKKILNDQTELTPEELNTIAQGTRFFTIEIYLPRGQHRTRATYYVIFLNIHFY